MDKIALAMKVVGIVMKIATYGADIKCVLSAIEEIEVETKDGSVGLNTINQTIKKYSDVEVTEDDVKMWFSDKSLAKTNIARKMIQFKYPQLDKSLLNVGIEIYFSINKDKKV